MQKTESKNKSGVALTIGNFDGCHLGHQALIAATCKWPHPQAMTFSPHPGNFFRPGSVADLFSHEQKVAALTALGIEQVHNQVFDKDFAQLAPESFLQVLFETLHVEHLVIGHDFRFGKDRQGDLAALESISKQHGVSVEVCSAQKAEQQPISSSRIRDLVKTGDLDGAQELLGHPYSIHSTIVRGKQLGRQLGFPTANMIPSGRQLPPYGVYAGYLQMDRISLYPDKDALPCVVNIGVRPTVDESKTVTVESHVLTDDSLDLYDREGCLFLTKHLRTEQKFADVDALKTQIKKDKEQALQLLTRHKDLQGPQS